MNQTIKVTGNEVLEAVGFQVRLRGIAEQGHLRRVFKLILTRWRSQPLTKRLRERQPITSRFESISSKPRLCYHRIYSQINDSAPITTRDHQYHRHKSHVLYILDIVDMVDFVDMSILLWS